VLNNNIKPQKPTNQTKKKKRNPGNKKLLRSNKNTTESHSNGLEQVEDRISGLKEKIDKMELTDEYIEKRLKNYAGICKNSVSPSKDQTYKSWASKKWFKPKA
jgi:hypothetical protein